MLQIPPFTEERGGQGGGSNKDGKGGRSVYTLMNETFPLEVNCWSTMLSSGIPWETLVIKNNDVEIREAHRVEAAARRICG
jgi:hypothetical protein